MAFHDDLPLGYKFRPDPEHLLLQFLRPVLEGEDFPNWLVPFCDMYGDQEPWQIWDEHFKRLSENDPERTDLYFITKHKKKTPKGKRTSRSVGRGGTWKGDDAAEPVVLSTSRDRKVIGRRKRFHYENKGSSQNGRWLVHEFELDASLLRDKRKANDYVLCILRKKIILVEKKSDHQDEEEDNKMSGEGGDDQQDGDIPEPKLLPEPELAKEQTRSTDTQASNDLRKNATEMEIHQANKKNDNKDAQQQEEHLKRVNQFQAFLMKQIADDQAKRKNDHKDSQKISLEELENFLMSDD